MNPTPELRQLIEALRATRDGEGTALVTLTRTHGSTFRRAGTRMLVRGGGSVVCELSGGCPQRDIVLRAQEAIAAGRPRLVAYNAESALDVLIEMGCGGELEVLVEPLSAEQAVAVAEALAHCLAARGEAWLASVFAVGGEVVPTGQVVCEAGEVCFDSLGDPVLTDAIAQAVAIVQEVSADGGRRVAALELPCRGGAAQVLVEPAVPARTLVAVGSRAGALALLPLAGALGWRTVLVDHDPQRLCAHELPPTLQAVCAGPQTLRETLALDAHSAVLVMTHNFEQDLAYLDALRGVPLAYLGVLGSRERAERLRGDPRFAACQLYAPAGLDLGSETPTEIAVSVVAEIMMVLNRRGGGPLRDGSGTLHG